MSKVPLEHGIDLFAGEHPHHSRDTCPRGLRFEDDAWRQLCHYLLVSPKFERTHGVLHSVLRHYPKDIELPGRRQLVITRVARGERDRCLVGQTIVFRRLPSPSRAFRGLAQSDFEHIDHSLHSVSLLSDSLGFRSLSGRSDSPAQRHDLVRHVYVDLAGGRVAVAQELSRDLRVNPSVVHRVPDLIAG